MSAEAGLRAALLIGVGALCAGTAAELALLGHTESPPQWIPFGLCAGGAAAAGAVLWRPARASVAILRGTSWALAVGSAIGAYEHFEHNLAFAAEIQPESPPGELWLEGVLGANPPLAPGVFAVVAFLGLAASWRHPAMSPDRS